MRKIDIKHPAPLTTKQLNANRFRPTFSGSGPVMVLLLATLLAKTDAQYSKLQWSFIQCD